MITRVKPKSYLLLFFIIFKKIKDYTFIIIIFVLFLQIN